MSVIRRIYQFIGTTDLKVSEFSKSIDVSNGYFTKQKAGNANVGSQIIDRIVRLYPQVNADWIISGRGKMLYEDNHNIITQESSLKEPAEPYIKKEPLDADDFFFELLARKEKEIRDLNREIGELKYKYERLLVKLELRAQE